MNQFEPPDFAVRSPAGAHAYSWGRSWSLSVRVAAGRRGQSHAKGAAELGRSRRIMRPSTWSGSVVLVPSPSGDHVTGRGALVATTGGEGVE